MVWGRGTLPLERRGWRMRRGAGDGGLEGGGGNWEAGAVIAIRELDRASGWRDVGSNAMDAHCCTVH